MNHARHTTFKTNQGSYGTRKKKTLVYLVDSIPKIENMQFFIDIMH